MTDTTLDELIDGAEAPVADRQVKVEAIAKAAVVWIYDRRCRNALADLERAVVDLMGWPLDELDDARSAGAEDLIG